MKYNMDQKLKMVHEYLDDKVSTLKLSKKYGYDLSKIKYMIKLTTFLLSFQMVVFSYSWKPKNTA